MTTTETAVDAVTAMLTTCPSRGMFAFQEVCDMVWTLAVYPEAVSKVGGDFLNAHRDEAHIGGGTVADLCLDVLIAIDKEAANAAV